MSICKYWCCALVAFPYFINRSNFLTTFVICSKSQLEEKDRFHDDQRAELIKAHRTEMVEVRDQLGSEIDSLKRQLERVNEFNKKAQSVAMTTMISKAEIGKEIQTTVADYQAKLLAAKEGFDEQMKLIVKKLG